MSDFTSGHGVPDDACEALIEDSLLYLVNNRSEVPDENVGDWLVNDIARRARHYARYIAPLSAERAENRRTIYRLPLVDLQHLRRSVSNAPSRSPIITVE